MQALFSFLNLVLPLYCASCQRYSLLFCHECAQKLKLFSPHCLYCQKTAAHAETHKICQTKAFFSFNIILFYYSKEIKRLFKLFKYGGAYQYASVLDEFSGHYIRADPFCIVKHNLRGKRVCLMPVPMHALKRKQRGFSPAELIARFLKKSLAGSCECMVDTHTVCKIKATNVQAGKQKALRFRNQMNVFDIHSDSFRSMLAWKPDVILIIDDVLSTGATVQSMLETLHEYAKSNLINTTAISFGVFAIARG